MNVYSRLKSILFKFPPEVAHDLAISILEASQNTIFQQLLEKKTKFQNEKLAQELWKKRFPNPVGLAAGFDKNGRIPPAVEGLGFGHLEVGGVTAEAQKGNEKPRLFRLKEDEALVNRMGFNNQGADRIAERLKSLNLPEIPVGINIGKSKSTPLEEAPSDYEYTFKKISSYGDYFVVNVSSPNTPGLRSLQQETSLGSILDKLKQLNAYPLLVKVSPDLEKETLEGIIELCETKELDGIVATNTTTNRGESLKSENQEEKGGLSGKPLENRSTQLVKFIAERTNLPIIGVGGIFTAEDAYRKIRSGASLIQLYTSFIYRGPMIARKINKGLLEKINEDGFDSLSEAVGTAI